MYESHWKHRVVRTMNPEQIVMMKRFIYILLLCLLISCESKVPIVSSDDFKQDVHRFPFSTYNMLCVELYEDNLYHTNRLDNRHLLLYDFKRNIIDTIISDNKVIDIIVVNDSSIFIQIIKLVTISWKMQMIILMTILKMFIIQFLILIGEMIIIVYRYFQHSL